VQLLHAEEAPLGEAQAAPLIERFLAGRKRLEIAAAEVKRSAPDGHTLLYTFNGTFAQMPFTQASELDPHNAQTWAGLGWALHLSGRSDEARPFLEKAASLDPTLALAARGLAALQNAPP